MNKLVLFIILMVVLNCSARAAVTCEIAYKKIGSLVVATEGSLTKVVVNGDANHPRTGNLNEGITIGADSNGYGVIDFYNLKSTDSKHFSIETDRYWTNYLHDGMKMYLVETLVNSIECK